jgi:hypothetical protein
VKLEQRDMKEIREPEIEKRAAAVNIKMFSMDKQK